MKNKIKNLAGQTMIYGLSSIVARIVPFLLITAHTAVLTEAQQGTNVELYVWVGFLVVIYAFGMETTYFKFVVDNPPQKILSAAFSWNVFVSITCTIILLLAAVPIAEILGKEVRPVYVQILAIILLIDGLAAIPFAKLRYEGKATRFVCIRFFNLILFVVLQLILLLFIPYIIENQNFGVISTWLSEWYTKEDLVLYIILSNLLANATYAFFFYKDFTSFTLKLDPELLLKMLIYAAPIVITGIGGLINERLDIRLLGSYYENIDLSPAEVKGIYGSAAKLAVMILLIVQAFRYAVEPFFFSNAKDKNAPALYSTVLTYFVLITTMGAVLISLNLYWIADIIIVQDTFKQALFIVPILLFARVFYGIYVNISIWFKLKNMTWVGTIITLIGSVITISLNIILIPTYNYLGPPLAALVCFFGMVVICAVWGNKFYPINYEWGKIGAIILIGGGFTYAANLWHIWDNLLLLIGANMTILAVVGIIVYTKLSTLR